MNSVYDYDDLTGVNPAMDESLNESKDYELDLYHSEQEFDVITNEITNLKRRGSELSTLYDDLREKGTVSKQDRNTVASILGNDNNLPSLESYTALDSHVNYQITLESVLDTIKDTVVDIIEAIKRFFSNAFKYLKSLLKDVVTPDDIIHPDNHDDITKAYEEAQKQQQEAMAKATAVSGQTGTDVAQDDFDDILNTFSDIKAMRGPFVVVKWADFRRELIGIARKNHIKLTTIRDHNISAVALLSEVYYLKLTPIHSRLRTMLHERNVALKKMIIDLLYLIETHGPAILDRVKLLTTLDPKYPPDDDWTSIIKSLPDSFTTLTNEITGKSLKANLPPVAIIKATKVYLDELSKNKSPDEMPEYTSPNNMMDLSWIGEIFSGLSSLDTINIKQDKLVFKGDKSLVDQGYYEAFINTRDDLEIIMSGLSIVRFLKKETNNYMKCINKVLKINKDILAVFDKYGVKSDV